LFLQVTPIPYPLLLLLLCWLLGGSRGQQAPSPIFLLLVLIMPNPACGGLLVEVVEVLRVKDILPGEGLGVAGVVLDWGVGLCCIEHRPRSYWEVSLPAPKQEVHITVVQEVDWVK
jgi:hypothetical protein